MAAKKTTTKQALALEAKVAGWKADLVSRSARKREAAARKLADVDPEGTRRTLLSALASAKTKAATSAIVGCLHWVADLEIARRIVADDDLELQPGRISTAILATLYEDLRSELASSSASALNRRVEKLAFLDPRTRYSHIEDRERWEDALRALLFAILDEKKLHGLHQEAGRAIRDLDDPGAWSTLVARWERSGDALRAFDVLAAWLRLDDRTPPSERLVSAVIEELAGAEGNVDRRRPPHEDESAPDWMDPRSFSTVRLAERVSRIPASQLRGLVVALDAVDPWPALTDEVAKRLVSLTDETDALVAILEDRRLSACHLHAARRLSSSAGKAGVRLVVERCDRLAPDAVETALSVADAADVFELLEGPIVTERGSGDPGASLYEIVLGIPAVLRDVRWFDVAERLPESGRRLLIAMARDPNNAHRTKAVDELAAAVSRANGRLEKREAVYALGETAHPHATLYLLAALDDPDLADGAPLICTALSNVGDTRAIPILEKRREGRHGNFIESAIAHIEARLEQIHAEVLLAAVQDDDPVIADLARRAQGGDRDSAIVLEDALRERGRL